MTGVENSVHNERTQPKQYILSACFDHPEEEHSGWWLGFPTTTESVQHVLKELGIFSGDVIANRHASGVTHLADCLSATMQPDNIDELNYLAVRLEGLTEIQIGVLESVLESRRHTDSVKDIINITYNLDRFDLQPAYSPEMYGDFLLGMEKDNTAEVFRRLEQSTDPDELAFVQYVLRLEAYIDESAYGRGVAEEESGVFTQHGYLTESEGFEEIYRGPEDIPAEYRVFAYPEPKQYVKTETADLAAFVYKVHALAGEYMSDAHYNVSALAGGSEYFLMLINSKNIYMCEMGSAYHNGTTANDIWFHNAVLPDMQAFAFRVTGRHDDRIFGSITEIDHAAQREDIIKHGFGFDYIDAILKDGTERMYTAQEWAALEPIDRDRLETWQRHYNLDDVDGLILHLEELTAQRDESAKRVPPEMILVDLNQSFLDKTSIDRTDIFLIAQSAAKEIIARGDAPVFRLLPDKDEPLTPMDVVRHGLNYSQWRNFAIKTEDADGFLKWAERGAADIVRRAADRDERDKPKSHGQEH